MLKVNLVYILAGTGIVDISKLPNTQEITQKINYNTVEFAPEMGRYFDAQLWIEAAVMDTVGTFIASASQARLRAAELQERVGENSRWRDTDDLRRADHAAGRRSERYLAA